MSEEEGASDIVSVPASRVLRTNHERGSNDDESKRISTACRGGHYPKRQDRKVEASTPRGMKSRKRRKAVGVKTTGAADDSSSPSDDDNSREDEDNNYKGAGEEEEGCSVSSSIPAAREMGGELRSIVKEDDWYDVTASASTLSTIRRKKRRKSFSSPLGSSFLVFGAGDEEEVPSFTRKRSCGEEDVMDHDRSSSSSQQQQHPHFMENFPSKLLNMLEQLDGEGMQSIASWLPDPHKNNETTPPETAGGARTTEEQEAGMCLGSNSTSRSYNAFKVHDPAKFVENVMPRFFQMTKFKSFLRQLNLWGFSRDRSKGQSNGSYYHKNFDRHNPELCKNMKRIKIKGFYKRGARSEASTKARRRTVVVSQREEVDERRRGSLQDHDGAPASSSRFLVPIPRKRTNVVAESQGTSWSEETTATAKAIVREAVLEQQPQEEEQNLDSLPPFMRELFEEGNSCSSATSTSFQEERRRAASSAWVFPEHTMNDAVTVVTGTNRSTGDDVSFTSSSFFRSASIRAGGGKSRNIQGALFPSSYIRVGGLPRRNIHGATGLIVGCDIPPAVVGFDDRVTRTSRVQSSYDASHHSFGGGGASFFLPPLPVATARLGHHRQQQEIYHEDQEEQEKHEQEHGGGAEQQEEVSSVELGYNNDWWKHHHSFSSKDFKYVMVGFQMGVTNKSKHTNEPRSQQNEQKTGSW